MRVFVAVVPDPDVVLHLAEFLEPRQEAGADLRWTDTHQWHLTLAFMPVVADHVVDDLTDALAAGLVDRSPLRLRLVGGGAFPSPDAARVLWTGVEGEVDDLRALARSVRALSNQVGAAPEGGPFSPHLTLARMRRPVEATRWLRILQAYAGPSWTAAEVTLVASHLGQGRGHRPRYEVLATVPLGSGGDRAAYAR